VSPDLLFTSLSRLALFASSSAPEQAKIKRKVKKTQKMMKKWAQYAPMNHLHKYLLVEAERNRVMGRDMSAIFYYDEAIKLGQRNMDIFMNKPLQMNWRQNFILPKGTSKKLYHICKMPGMAF
jgi:hypothetical protein